MPWQHEREIRVFTEQPYVDVQLKELVLGCRISDADERLVRALVAKWHPKIRIRKVNTRSLDQPLPD